MATEARRFELAPLRTISVWMAALFLGVLPVVFVMALLVVPQSHPMPGAPMLVAPALVIVVCGGSLLSFKRRRIELRDGVLVVAATIYTKKVPAAMLDLDRARIASLDEHTDYRPWIKTNGYALPGFQAGHFRLRNKSKAFCLLTQHERTLILPLRDDSSVLLSLERPQALLDALRAQAA